METKFARQIAARRSEGQHARARQKMIERLLLYRIDTEAARAAIGEQFDLSAVGPANEAQSTLAITQLARSRADIALHPAIIQRVPVFRLDDRAVRRLRRKRLWPVHAPIMRSRQICGAPASARNRCSLQSLAGAGAFVAHWQKESNEAWSAGLIRICHPSAQACCCIATAAQAWKFSWFTLADPSGRKRTKVPGRCPRGSSTRANKSSLAHGASSGKRPDSNLRQAAPSSISGPTANRAASA